ncbi:MAG TPA: glutathione synthase [Candidatus Lokiarchaeia archaeon]|nr:glutathione synthase [Candidatus Lokiarchaeia archaeon]
MNWLFVIDPLETLHFETDSTFAIMKEAIRQSVHVFHCRTQDLFYENKSAMCFVRPFCSPEEQTDDIPNVEAYQLDFFDLIFMRKDPPYDLTYHYATQLLSLTQSPVVNSPSALRSFNEKLIILPFPELIPETIVTAQASQIMSFLESHPDGIIIKSLDSYQGRSVEWIRDASPASTEVIRKYAFDFSTPIMVQEFLPQVFEGDKRVLVLGGKAIGAVTRVPKQDSFLANFAQGGEGQLAEITSRDEEIVGTISDFLVKNGMLFVGIDIIGGFMTEINITCPTGIVQIDNLNGVNLEREIVSYFVDDFPATFVTRQEV